MDILVSQYDDVIAMEVSKIFRFHIFSPSFGVCIFSINRLGKRLPIFRCVYDFKLPFFGGGPSIVVYLP